MLAWLILALGLGFTTLGSYLDLALNFTVPIFNIPIHLGIATLGLILIVMAITAALRFVEQTVGLFAYTILIIALTAGIIYGVFLSGLAPLLLPRIGVSTPSTSYSYGGTGSSPTIPAANATSTQTGYSPPSGLPSFPNDPLGINAWFANNPGSLTLILEGVLIAGIALALVVFFLRRNGSSLLPEIGSLD